MRYLVGLVFVLALGSAGCGETAGMGGSGGTGGTGGMGGSGGTAGTGGTGGTAEQCDDGTPAAYDSARCEACVACAIDGPCQQCNAQSCQDFLGCALGCTSVECTASCIDRYPAGAALFWQSYLCAFCDTCPNNCGFPAPPLSCDSGIMTCFEDDECSGSLICCHGGGPLTPGICVTEAVCDELQAGAMTCFQDDECTGSLICCHTDGPLTLGICVTQAVCDELQGGFGTGGSAGNGGTGGSNL